MENILFDFRGMLEHILFYFRSPRLRQVMEGLALHTLDRVS